MGIAYLFLLLLRGLAVVDSARILVLIPLSTKSHTFGFEPLYHELAARGHAITIVTNYPRSNVGPNLRYIMNFNTENVVAKMNPFQSRLDGRAINSFDLTPLYETMCHHTYENPEVTNLLKEDFDLIIINSFLSECIYGLADQFKQAKIMFFSTLPLLSWVSSELGNPVTPSHTPLFTRGYGDRMTFSQRVRNFLDTVHYYYLRNYYHVPRMEAVYQSYFPDSPSVETFEKRVEIILINSHPIVNYPRTLLPNMIETSGLHCREGKPLPPDLINFINGSGEAGFIYFSFGSFLQGSQLPEKFQLAFLRAFSKLKQRVIWKFETEEMENLPSNVKLVKWLPQQDLLAHPSIRLFITHGGLLSIQEAVYHGVPLLGIPFFGDQDGNLEQASRRGISTTLNFEEISEELITEKVSQILQNESYKFQAKMVSTAFRDREIPPMDAALFWTEYLLRRNVTSQLHFASRDLSIIQFHSFDVLGVLGGALLMAAYITLKSFIISFRIFEALRRRMTGK